MKGILFLFFLIFSLDAVCQTPGLLDTTMAKALNEDGYRDTKNSFKYFSSKSTSGTTYTADSLKNKITFINFWFEACAPCIAEFDALNKLYDKYKECSDFQFLSFTFETPENAKRVMIEYKVKYPVLCIEQKDIYNLIFQLGFPTTIITDKSGLIAFIICGGPAEEEKATEVVNSLYVKEIERLLFCQ